MSRASKAGDRSKAVRESLGKARDESLGRLGNQAIALERLLGINRDIAVLDLDGALRTILHSVLELTKMGRGAVFLSGATGEWAFRGGLERDRLETPPEEFPISRSMVKRAAANGEVVAVEDLGDLPVEQRASAEALRLRSILAIPLQTRHRTVGVLYLDSERPSSSIHFRDPAILLAFGAQAAIAIENASLHRELQEDHLRLRQTVGRSFRFGRLRYRSAAMERVCQSIRQVASRDLTILIQGETGTGKELVAREIHRLSCRPEARFVCVNSGAIPDNLIESELFGHRRGAFSGAVRDQPGLVEAADGGTLLLDEIGEASPALQVRLLRFLESGTFRRLGEGSLRTARVRLLAATHRNLSDMVRGGTFRADLYYRLHVFPIHLPPLRERPEDVTILAEHFIERFNGRLGTEIRRISQRGLEILRSSGWPGNVRQLEHTLQRLMIQTQGPVLEVEPADVDGPGVSGEISAVAGSSCPGEPAAASADVAEPRQAPGLPRSPPEIESLEAVERRYLRAALGAVGGNQTEAARRLGLKRSTFRGRLEKHGLLP